MSGSPYSSRYGKGITGSGETPHATCIQASTDHSEVMYRQGSVVTPPRGDSPPDQASLFRYRLCKELCRGLGCRCRHLERGGFMPSPCTHLVGTTPSACRSPLCFLRSSRRWLRCCFRTRLVLACSRTSPRQLLPLFPSPFPATRVPMSFDRQSRFVRRWVVSLPSARPVRRESLSVVYLERAGLPLWGKCTGQSGSSRKHALLAAAAMVTVFFYAVTASLLPAPFVAPLSTGIMHMGYPLPGPSGLFSRC